MSLFELRDSQGQRYALKGEVTRMGRADDNDIVLRDQNISRYHLNFYVREGQLTVENAGAQGGFYINGNLIQDATVLAAGDRISIGLRRFEVIAAGTAATSTNSARAFSTGTIPLNVESRHTTSSNRRPLLYGGLGLLVIIAVVSGKSKETRQPASLKEDVVSTALPTDDFKAESFNQKSLTEVQAESRFRESLRDYYNGNYSRALLGFQEALTLSPSHERAGEYIQLTEGRIREQLDNLLKDAERSYSLLQFHRVKSQAARVLTILSEQVPGYSRRIAQESSSTDLEDTRRPQGQEETLLKIPCDRTNAQEMCTRALDLIKNSRQRLGEEDTLK